MSIRINLEIGHEASVRSKHTPDGFTHDWEVFVRGSDNANIQQYVDKVVFYLHDTFKNPKRVKKEPPYTVKESGYAGFILLIEVYLRNKDEPKKLKFCYDLTLQKTGPAIYKLQKEKYVFNAPSEEFKQKLLKGGGVVINTQEGSRENRTSSEEKSQLISKPRLSGTDYTKKHKPKIESNNFQELFGTPITKTSKSIETKPVVKEKSSINTGSSKQGSSEKEKLKYSPYNKEKDKERERLKDKSDFNRKDRDEKRKDDKKERSRDREKKERRDKSPRSPTPSKKLSSPKRPISPSPKFKEKEEKKIDVQKKNGDNIKDKSEKKIKKDKRDKEKDKYENKRKDEQKIVDLKEKNTSSKEKVKEASPLVPLKPEKKEKINLKDFIKETENGKIKSDKTDVKIKHKHKKKDKERDKINEKEKLYKPEKKGEKPKDIKPQEKQPSLFDSPKENKKSEKNTHLVLPECSDSDDSNSSISSPEPSFNDPIIKNDQSHEPQPPSPPPPPPPLEVPKPDKPKKEKRIKDKKADKDTERKRKRKADQKQIEEPLQKVVKEDTPSMNNISKEMEVEPEPEVRRSTSEASDENCEDYMNILRDLQQKILTLQDNSELQKVVELIAETGRYEVSAQTFDFDLCLLERSTILQLQHFFESTS